MSATTSRNSGQKKKIREKLVKRDGRYCHYCDKPMRKPGSGPIIGTVMTIEHVVPLDLGGSWSLSNLVLSCYRCNSDFANQDNKCGCDFCESARFNHSILQ